MGLYIRVNEQTSLDGIGFGAVQFEQISTLHEAWDYAKAAGQSARTHVCPSMAQAYFNAADQIAKMIQAETQAGTTIFTPVDAQLTAARVETAKDLILLAREACQKAPDYAGRAGAQYPAAPVEEPTPEPSGRTKTTVIIPEGTGVRTAGVGGLGFLLLGGLALWGLSKLGKKKTASRRRKRRSRKRRR